MDIEVWAELQGWHMILIDGVQEFHVWCTGEGKAHRQGERARLVCEPHEGLEVHREAMIYTWERLLGIHV